MRKSILAVAVLGLIAAAALPSTASAVSSYYTSQGCSGCHGATPTTCNGCHQHGPSGLAGSLSATTLTPGQGFNVSVTAGSRSGWWRAAVLDAANNVVGQVSMTASGTATVAVTAPATAGTYTWKAAWYGNQYGGPSGAWVADPGNSNHGYRTVTLPAFTVAAVQAPAPVAGLSAATLAFGNVTVGQSTTRTASVTNTGNAALSVTAVTPCTNTVPPFGITPSAGFSVAAGGSQVLTVSFAPTSSGAVTGCFDISTNDAAHATLRLSVTGTGAAVPTPSASLTPATVAFGNLAAGQASTLTATVRNTGAAPLSVSGVTACDSSNAAALTVSPTAAFTVAAGGSQALTVRFAPTAAGAAAACWNVATNDPANASLQLRATGTGTAVVPTAPIASLAPATLGFGNVTVGQSASLTATVGNTGTAALAVSGVTACAGTNAAALSITPTAAFSVAAGGRQVLTVRFAPTAAGAAAACWNVATNDPANASLQLNVSGTGVAVTPPPTGCTGCHAIPPATGRHAKHQGEGVGCGTCHGSGYSSTAVNAATHNDGTKNVAAAAGFNATSRTCANSCHGSETWGGTVTPPPPPPPTGGSCTSCHAIPPATGRHALHKSEGVGCRSCHGSGYSTTTVASATHQNGKVNLSTRSGWRVTSRTCANSCHDSERWSTSTSTSHDDGDDREDDDFVLTADEEAAAGGCSSAGASTSLLGLLGVGALGLLRRRRRA